MILSLLANTNKHTGLNSKLSIIRFIYFHVDFQYNKYLIDDKKNWFVKSKNINSVPNYNTSCINVTGAYCVYLIFTFKLKRKNKTTALEYSTRGARSKCLTFSNSYIKIDRSQLIIIIFTMFHVSSSMLNILSLS